MDLLRIHFFPPTTCFEGYTVYIDSTMVERIVCSISFWNIGFEFLCNAQKPPETRNEPRLIIYYICSQESIATRECRNLLFWVHVLAKQDNLEWTGICEHVPQIWSSTTNRYICYSLGISTSVFIPVKSKFLFVQVIRFHIKYPMQYNNNSPNGLYKKWKVLYSSWWNI